MRNVIGMRYCVWMWIIMCCMILSININLLMQIWAYMSDDVDSVFCLSQLQLLLLPMYCCRRRRHHRPYRECLMQWNFGTHSHTLWILEYRCYIYIRIYLVSIIFRLSRTITNKLGILRLKHVQHHHIYKKRSISFSLSILFFKSINSMYIPANVQNLDDASKNKLLPFISYRCDERALYTTLNDCFIHVGFKTITFSYITAWNFKIA